MANHNCPGRVNNIPPLEGNVWQLIGVFRETSLNGTVVGRTANVQVSNSSSECNATRLK